MADQPKSIADFIEEIRTGLVCERCGRYVGSLAKSRYLPPPYPVALDRMGTEQEVEALIGFEWHMLSLMREGRFVIRHPEREGRCVSIQEWAEHQEEDEQGDEAEASGGPDN